ncbi:Uncharacterized protein APZ42_013289 [Daphnia magna]|uniref:Uncharacterized protein n=1 Tax=Daphnia magna TaxID=35525 RepID=A0A0P5D1J6_9CRUS|nr:Uncharacterized protein APZ42_013289 [Daphnia magna]
MSNGTSYRDGRTCQKFWMNELMDLSCILVWDLNTQFDQSFKSLSNFAARLGFGNCR